MFTSTQGNLHSRFPKELLNHSRPMPAHRPTSTSTSSRVIWSPGPGAIDELVLARDDCDSGRGSNQWPLLVSRKQRSDQWHDDVKRMSIMTEQ